MNIGKTTTDGQDVPGYPDTLYIERPIWGVGGSGVMLSLNARLRVASGSTNLRMCAHGNTPPHYLLGTSSPVAVSNTSMAWITFAMAGQAFSGIDAMNLCLSYQAAGAFRHLYDASEANSATTEINDEYDDGPPSELGTLTPDESTAYGAYLEALMDPYEAGLSVLGPTAARLAWSTMTDAARTAQKVQVNVNAGGWQDYDTNVAASAVQLDLTALPPARSIAARVCALAGAIPSGYAAASAILLRGPGYYHQHLMRGA